MAACDTLLDTDPEAFAKMDCEELSEWIEIVFDEKFVKLYELDQVAKTETRLTCQGFALESGAGERWYEFHAELDREDELLFGYRRP